MNSQSTVRLVIGVLGLLALAVVVGGIILALDDKALPGELIAIGSAAAGAVGGILSKTGDAEVTIVNDEDDPVPVAGRPLRADRGHVDARAIAVVALVVALVCLVVL